MRHRAFQLINVLVLVPVVVAAATWTSARVPAMASSPAPEQVVVALDPGHGGTADNNHPAILFDPGVVARNGLLEKDITLDVALRTRSLLEADGVRVVMTRSTDTYVDISPRMEAANLAGAALFVSIHFNYYPDPAIGGSLVLYPNDNSLAFAQVMTGALAKRLSAFNLQDNPPVLDNKLWVHAQMPAVTLEPAYLSNFHDSDVLRHGELRAAIAGAVRDGIEAQAPQILQRKPAILAARASHAAATTSHPGDRLARVPLPPPLATAGLLLLVALFVVRRRVLPTATAVVGATAALVAARLGYAPSRARRRRAGRRHAPPPTWSPPPRRARRSSARPLPGASPAVKSRHR